MKVIRPCLVTNRVGTHQTNRREWPTDDPQLTKDTHVDIFKETKGLLDFTFDDVEDFPCSRFRT